MMPQFSVFAVMSIALCGTFASADVSSLGYNRFGRLTTRLQRQEVGPAPYPAAGYRPRQPFEFPTPDKQQFFPNGGEGKRPHSLAPPQPRPQDQPQFQPEAQFEPQPQPQPQPEPLPPQPEVSGFDLEATPNLGSNGDHIDAPNTLYDAPSRFRVAQVGRQRFSFSRQQFSAAAPQQSRQQQNFRQNFEATAPQRLYGAPADNSVAYTRQRQQFAAAQQSFAQAPQGAYGPPAAAEEPQAERLTSAVKSERLTAEQPEQQREEREEEAEVATDIEVTEVKKTTPAAAAPTPATNVFYYPATAVGFVHPLTAAYYQPTTFLAAAAAAPAPAPTPAVATTATPASQESSAAAPAEANAKPARLSALAVQTAAPAVATLAAPQYFAAPPYLQQYAFAAPAQLQAW
ncbi:skin secretory protein xP2 [Bactrocera neohumeralis]|uniref:skin secretory protein xP2 n=1 Tax=Bactrocera neohumeralis TaxID=98809 RepID=UPI002165BA56|nr:skin secretory protein xP2 [Bactrocera neohumeralis]